MSVFRELLPGRKLQHEGDQGAPGRLHDPGGPLDLDKGVVYLAPPEHPREQEQEAEDPAPESDG
ncbi:hypothetical protein [Saccharopolyspora taberi]|uniref:Uncharacterized protein n=1 Tax=Saccharopolyspora taberi TaxID=60895 RepID=A0ABN3V512_9PSEU